MEFKKAEAESIKQQLSEWLVKDENEVECTFGGGTVDATTFFQVAQRLRSKGLTEISQEDRVTITTPEHIRFTLLGIGAIQDYCKDDTLDGKAYSVMIKDRNSENDTLDIPDYDIRIKSRRERGIGQNDTDVQELLANWPAVKKGFRLMRRWSFEETGLQYDLSIVRSTARDLRNPDIKKRGGFKWQRKFTDQNISGAPYLYEIEVELKHMAGDTVEIAQKRLIKGIGEILRGIQKSSILIRKSKKQSVLQSYKEITKTDRFLGCSPITLEQKNFTDMVKANVPNIRTGYNVTDKADGLRCLAYCDRMGELYLIDMAMNVYRTGLSSIDHRESILDGEWVTHDREKKPVNLYLIFDIYYGPDKLNVSQFPFYNKDNENESRIYAIKQWVEKFNKGDGPKKLLSYLTFQTTLQVSMKTFLFAKENDLSIFKYASEVLNRKRIYYTDGLIFTPNTLPLPGYDTTKDIINPGTTFRSQFKWKPSTDNTVDFLVRYEPDAENKLIDRISIGIKPITDETVRYKTLRLYVGSDRPKSYKPREMMLHEHKPETTRRSNDYFAVPFYPKKFSDTKANICYSEIHTDNATQEDYVSTELNNEPIQDESIIEMRYDPSKPQGWRWIPMRIRQDKTERLKKGLQGTLNNENTAESIWNSIHEPITLSMIITGASEPTDEEKNSIFGKLEQSSGKYFNREEMVDNKSYVRGLRDFHNLFIKNIILYDSCLKGGEKTLIDLGCGKGSDIRRWYHNKLSFVLGIDYSEDNITNIKDGAYSRYIGINSEPNTILPPMVFVIGDSSKRLIDGKAGTYPEESDILRSIFGQYNPTTGNLPVYVDKNAGGLLKHGADTMSCMFALHYFFENEEKLNGLLRNIREGLKVGGYFFGCCFDGESVFNFLKNTPTGGLIKGVEKSSTLWTIRKNYDADELVPNSDSIGTKINVNFISIGASHDEYLVSFPYFIEKMKTIGCELLSDEKAKEIGLAHGTEMFGDTYKSAKDYGKSYKMSKAEMDFSFLNRWFIFVKTEDVLLDQGEPNEEFIPITPKFLATTPIIDKKTPSAPLSMKSVMHKTLADKVLYAEKGERKVEDESSRLMNSIALKEGEEREEREEREEGKDEEVLRTIPVEKSSALPSKIYTLNQVFKFYFNAPLEDKLKMNDKEAASYISPQYPFQIRDFDDPKIIYPSIEHFMAGMVYKYGTNKPDLADTLFGRTGSIHQEFLRKRLLASKGGQETIPYDVDHDLLNEELAVIRTELRPITIVKKHGAVFNETNFTIKKDELLDKAVKYRYDNDERMRKILLAAKKSGKYLLYHTVGNIRTNANLGGIRKTSGIIEGSNKLGKLYMKISGFPD